MPVHTHFDHALDSAEVARRTGALLLGGESAANLGRGAGLPADRIRVVTPGEPLTCGTFTLTLLRSAHCPPDRAGFVPGALTGHRADVVYLGVGQLGVLDESYLRAYWAETVEAVGARRVILTHWDDFFRPLDRPPRALPYAGDDLDVTLRVFGRLAADRHIPLHLPTVWRRENPWL